MASLAGQLWLGTLMVVVTVVFHAGGLVGLSTLLRRLGRSLKNRGAAARAMVLLNTTVLTILFIHIAEVWGWAALYVYLGEFAEFDRALYFSAVTATTLGYGDVTLTEQWQLLSTIEAMGGLILFGASTAFFMAAMRRVFEAEIHPPHTAD